MEYSEPTHLQCRGAQLHKANLRAEQHGGQKQETFSVELHSDWKSDLAEAVLMLAKTCDGCFWVQSLEDKMSTKSSSLCGCSGLWLGACIEQY